MKEVYKAIINIMAFYFLVSLFNGVLGINTAGATGFAKIFLPALVFGILFALLPSLLKFFKISESNGALFLGGLVLNFIYYFVGYYLLKWFSINTGRVVLGFDFLSFTVDDRTLGLIVISLISSAVSVILLALSKQK